MKSSNETVKRYFLQQVKLIQNYIKYNFNQKYRKMMKN